MDVGPPDPTFGIPELVAALPWLAETFAHYGFTNARVFPGFFYQKHMFFCLVRDGVPRVDMSSIRRKRKCGKRVREILGIMNDYSVLTTLERVENRFVKRIVARSIDLLEPPDQVRQRLEAQCGPDWFWIK